MAQPTQQTDGASNNQGGFGVTFRQEVDAASGVPTISSRRRRNLGKETPAHQTDLPAHTSRLIGLEVNPGAASLGASIKTLRKWGGFVDRSKAWAKLLFGDDKADLKDDRNRYWNRLAGMFEKCAGCEVLLCSHVSTFGASFLSYDESVEDEADIEQLWEREVFSRHCIVQEDQKKSIKRVLMALEDEYDFEFAPQIVDLVCLLSLHLSEVQTYAAIRRLITVSSNKFVKMPRDRKGSTPRRFFSVTFASQRSLSFAFIQVVKKLDSSLGSILTEQASHVHSWFERWLIPILPMNAVLVLLDCLIAGDDAKLMYRACYQALRSAKPSLVGPSHATRPDLTEVVHKSVQSKEKKSATNHGLNLAPRFPKRRVLIPVEAALGLKDFGKVPRKMPIAHVCREAFLHSPTILTFEAASRLVKMIPSPYRHPCSRIRSIFRSEVGPMGESTLGELYNACAKEKNCCYIMLIAAKVPHDANDLNGKRMDEKHRTKSTTFSHPLDKEESNYVVFGIFSPAPFVQSFERASSTRTVRPTDAVGDENTFIFRLAPSFCCRKWTNQSTSDNRLVMCMAKSLMVGEVTWANADCDKQPDLDEVEDSVDKAGDSAEYKSLNVGPALLLNYNLKVGSSGYSETFKNEPLCMVTDDGVPPDYAADPAAKALHYYFNIFAVEVFALPKV